MNELCEFYPSEEELSEHGPFCHCGSEVSGCAPCTKEESEACEWANRTRRGEE
jgi:hypothetical protein